MGKGKRLGAIAKAVSEILGSEVRKKKLKKKKALRKFIGKMEGTLESLRGQLSQHGLGADEADTLARNVDTLQTQIAKAKDILSEMETQASEGPG